MDTTNWTYQDYLTYLFLYAAREDFEVDKEEIDWIVNRVGKKEYKKVLAVFETNLETEHLQIVQQFGKSYCRSEEQKQRVLDDLKDMFESDGRFSDIEQMLLLGIGKLL